MTGSLRSPGFRRLLAAGFAAPCGLPVLLNVQAGLYALAGVLALKHRWGGRQEEPGGHLGHRAAPVARRPDHNPLGPLPGPRPRRRR